MEQTANALPPVTLGQYKGLPVTRRVRPVTEAAVASELKSLARRHAPFCATSAPAARGMRVTLDFEGFLDGAPIPDSRMEQVTVTLGTAQLMPAAEQAVYGHCAGETFRFDFTYPDEFRVPELSGKTAQFEICLHTVEQKQEPTVDDALAQRLGFATLSALRILSRYGRPGTCGRSDWRSSTSNPRSSRPPVHRVPFSSFHASRATR